MSFASRSLFVCVLFLLHVRFSETVKIKIKIFFQVIRGAI